nr:aldose epimerase family protein [Amylibacter sp.]
MPSAADIRSFTLETAQSAVTLLNLGCVTQSWVSSFGAAQRSIVLGYRDPAAYLTNPQFLGAIVGRVANRIANARFELDGVGYHLDANVPPHILHGGHDGLHQRIWDADADGSRAVQLRLQSPDGDQGFAGAVDFTVEISLSDNSLTYQMTAEVDRPTPINLAQHSYYNLAGSGPIKHHRLHVAADAILNTDAAGIPLGPMHSLNGQPLDFRTGKTIQAGDPQSHGIDHNYCLTPDTPAPQARLSASGLALSFHTDQPGLQVYTASNLSPVAPPLHGQIHSAFTGICLEPQGYPDALNQPSYPTIVVTPDRPYSQRLTIALDHESLT